MDDLSWKILMMVAKRGHIGATREDFFTDIRGLVYEDLEAAILSLERDDYISVEWLGPNKFLCMIREKGSELVKEEYEKRLRAYHKRIDEQRGMSGLEKI